MDWSREFRKCSAEEVARRSRARQRYVLVVRQVQVPSIGVSVGVVGCARSEGRNPRNVREQAPKRENQSAPSLLLCFRAMTDVLKWV